MLSVYQRAKHKSVFAAINRASTTLVLVAPPHQVLLKREKILRIVKNTLETSKFRMLERH